MFNSQVQQAQQKINSLQQMVAQLSQSEQNNHQRLQQIAQDEAYASQQLQRVQQICQDISSTLQNVSLTQPSYASTGQFQTYQTAGISPTGMMHGNITPQSGSPLGMTMYGTTPSMMPGYHSSSTFDPTTMNPQTYQGTMQTFSSVPGMGAVQPQFHQPIQQMGAIGSHTLQGTTGLSNIATMSPSTYEASQQQLGRGQSSLSQIAQQAGISGTPLASQNAGQMSGFTGMSGIGGSTLSSIATMSPSTYEASQQQLGGMSSNLSQIGQQAGITSTPSISR